MSSNNQQEHELLLKVFEASPIAIVVLNREGKIYLANAQAEKTLGLTRKDLTKQTYDDPQLVITDFDGNPLPSENLPFEVVKNTHNPLSNIHNAITMGNGQRVFLNVNATPLFNKRGHFDGVVALIEDITERKQMEERIRHSEKMEAVGQLAGGIAHDFNNQLAGIMGCADLLREKAGNDPAVTRYANNIFTGVRRAAELTAQLLAFARKGKYITAPVDMHRIICEVITLIKHVLKKNIAIRQFLNAAPSTTMGDPSQLQNSILNLALNARDAMPSGGELTFTTGIVEIDRTNGKEMMFDIEPGTYVRIDVSDTGVGIDPAIYSKIFEPFFTTKGEGKGTGLGLSAVYGTVKNHRGGIAIRSETGKGSTFSLLLPSFAVDAVQERSSQTPATVTAKLNKHVLIVDDEESIRQVAAVMTASMGCRVTTCSDGQEALDIYRRIGDTIDAVFLDLVMPNMDGIVAYRALKEINPRVRVLLSSGYSVDGDAQQLLKEGVNDFIQKPFSKADLISKLAGLLEA